MNIMHPAESILTSPGPLSTRPTPGETNDALSLVAGPAVPWPEHRCIHQLFEDQVLRTPHSVAVDCAGTRLTYHELNQRANQLAHSLRKTGIQRGTLVGVGLEASLEAVVAIYGVLKSGGAYVPLDPAYPQERLTYMLQAADCRVLITSSRLSSRFGRPSGLRVVELDTEGINLAAECPENPPPVARPDSLIYVIFTSGSTGRPKGAAVYHRGFSNLLHWFVTEFSIDSSDRTLLVSSLSFDLTQKNLYAPLVCGGALHLRPPGPFDVTLLAALIQRHSISLINCTPSAFYPLVEDAAEPVFRQLSSLRIVFLGGEPISVPRLRSWLANSYCRADVANTYGPTECTDICAAFRLSRADVNDYDFVPLGRPIYNVQLVIADSDLRPCPVGVAGELCVAGAGVGAGYVNDPDLTAARFLPSPFPNSIGPRVYRTGDQARLTPDGMIEFLGRLDHQVKIRGFRIELSEIERVLNGHLAVRDAVVVVHRALEGMGDPRLVCFFTTKAGSSLDPVALKEYLRDRVPDYMIPAAFRALPEFPLSPNGKVDRKALECLPDVVPLADRGLGTAAHGLESMILGLWQEVLGCQPGLDDNFFDLGGNSIQVAVVHSRLQTLLHIEFPITELFTFTTIRTLAAWLSGKPTPVDEEQTRLERARRQRLAFTGAFPRGARTRA